ncbi:MAG: ABC-F family ATP-binding cassette domain-containing protein [Alphaproteobacteria bacterium]
MAGEPPILALRGASLTFGGEPLFRDVELALQPGARACLVGRNGSGKSTLMKVLAGLVEIDSGERYVEPGLTIGYLPQDVPMPPAGTVADFVAAGADPPAPRHAVDEILALVGIEGGRSTTGLSGGEARRAAMARAMLGDPDVLLLDEPTNHLDLPTILWLEKTLAARRQAVLTISHDRRFLANVTRQTFWVWRRTVYANNAGYADWEAWTERVLADEDAAARKLDQKLKAEARWLERGVTARRRRNQGRLAKLTAMRAARRALLTGGRNLEALEASTGPVASRLVIDAEHLGKTFGERVIVRDFSTRVLRGDRIGVIGPNGAGKTTLLRLLTGRLAPDRGTIRLAPTLAVAYFDQTRETLDPDATLWRTLTPGGGDSVDVRGHMRHVVAYLRDFMFDEKQAKAPVSTLSGGEKNRLLLAKTLARPADLMVLDEPTNDLDADTLDMLQEMLDDYEGTLIVVSHDRDFLDRTVSSTIAVEGDGEVGEYAGGYDDYVRARGTAATAARTRAAAARPAAKAEPVRPAAPAGTGRLSFNEQRELDTLPATIAGLEDAKAKLEAALADPAVWAKDATKAAATAKKLEEVRATIARSEERWLDLEARREAAAARA